MHLHAVPPTTSVRRNRAHNVDTLRLLERRLFLIDNVLDGRFDGPRCDFAARAYELQAIENVLEDRGHFVGRRTVRGNVRGLTR